MCLHKNTSQPAKRDIFMKNKSLGLLEILIYCFFRGHGNESCNLIGSLPGQYFPISAHGPR